MQAEDGRLLPSASQTGEKEIAKSMNSIIENLYFASPVKLQNILVSVMGYKLYRKRYTGIYHELRELVRESREWTEARRSSYQSEQLHLMIKHCLDNVPYYQAMFAEYGLHKNDITDTSDLRKLPVLDKQTLRERGQEFRSGREKPFMIQHTSGSTGTPLALHVNELTYKLAMALLVDYEEFHGVPFGRRRATFAGRMIQRPENMTPPFSRFNCAENQRLYSSYHLNEKTFPHYQRDLDRFQPLEIIGYPSAISNLASYYQRSGNQPRFQPIAIFTNSETLLATQRERIETVFNCPVYDYYGTAEYVIFAGQQEQNGAYYTNPVIGITEGQPIESTDDSINILATTLTNTSMPLIRYSIGDIATVDSALKPGQSVVSRLGAITGREDDYIITPDGRCFGRMDHIFKGLSGIKEAQLIQDSPNHCIVRIVPELEQTRVNTSLLEHNFKSRVGDCISLSVEYAQEIPRNKNGKFRSVITLYQG